MALIVSAILSYSMQIKVKIKNCKAKRCGPKVWTVYTLRQFVCVCFFPPLPSERQSQLAYYMR